MIGYYCYITDSDYFKKMNQGIKPYQGWSNSATWCFNLYFLQECKNYEALKALIRKDGTINENRAIKLFNRSNICSQIDNWCEGDINVPEILNEFEDSFK